jgi:hypothetical protein
MEKKSSANLLINSTLAFVAAFVFTTVFHELGHYLSYLFFGSSPTLFHNYVQTSAQNLETNTRIISALAGPFFSLIQGCTFGIIIVKNKNNSAAYLFFLWLSLLGFINFFGYLMLTPFTSAGDTGAVAELLNCGFALRIMVSIVGFFALLWIIIKVAKNFAVFIPYTTERKLKASYVYRVMFFPIIFGSVISAFLAFPIVSILSVIYPATSPYMIMSSFSAIVKFSDHQTTYSEIEEHLMKSYIILTISAIALNRLLTIGIN